MAHEAPGCRLGELTQCQISLPRYLSGGRTCEGVLAISWLHHTGVAAPGALRTRSGRCSWHLTAIIVLGPCKGQGEGSPLLIMYSY